jgi:hypothetical protein
MELQDLPMVLFREIISYCVPMHCEFRVPHKTGAELMYARMLRLRLVSNEYMPIIHRLYTLIIRYGDLLAKKRNFFASNIGQNIPTPAARAQAWRARRSCSIHIEPDLEQG